MAGNSKYHLIASPSRIGGNILHILILVIHDVVVRVEITAKRLEPWMGKLFW